MKKKTKNKIDKKFIFLVFILVSLFVSVLIDDISKNKKFLKNLHDTEEILYSSATGVVGVVYTSIYDMGHIISDLYNMDVRLISFALANIYQTLSELGTFPLYFFDFVGNSLYSGLEQMSIFAGTNDIDRKFENYLSNVSSGYEYASSDLEINYSVFDNTLQKLDFDFTDVIVESFKKFILFIINSIKSLVNIFKNGLDIFSFGVIDYSRTFSSNLNNNIGFINKELGSLRADVSSCVSSIGEKVSFWISGLSGRNCSNQ